LEIAVEAAPRHSGACHDVVDRGSCETVAVKQLQCTLDNSLPDLFTVMRLTGHSHPRADAELLGRICLRTYDNRVLIMLLPKIPSAHLLTGTTDLATRPVKTFMTFQRRVSFLDHENVIAAKIDGCKSLQDLVEQISLMQNAQRIRAPRNTLSGPTLS
jgi:hypothetical protein